ncbi:PspC domain-containing protein [Kitasatospora kazusensis]|uniref:PspC domain-containing protein n=1 Tax=Kitasatospora kazusensis TaxID=407974 RepID=A0ABN2YPP2_9ACTN
MTDDHGTAAHPTGAPGGTSADAPAGPPADPDGTPPDGTPPAGQRPPLTRSEQHRVVAGVCGGLGRHLDIDPVVFRVVTAVLCLSGGLGLFLYGLGWLIVPKEPVEGRPGRTELQRVLTGRVDGQSIGAVLMTVIGTGVFFSSMDDDGQLFPLLLLGGLVFLAVRYDPERRRRGGRSGLRHHLGGPADRPPGGRPAWKEQFAEDFHREWQGRRAGFDAQLRERFGAARGQAADRPADTPPPGPSGYLWDPRHPERNPYSGQTPWWQRTDLPEGDPLRKSAPAAPAAPVPPPVPRRTARSRSFLAPLGLLLAAAAGTATWWAAWSHGGDVRISTVLAAALLGLAVPLLVGAKFGRARGLAVPALLLTLALAGSAATDTTVRSGFGDRSWAPTTAAGLQPRYDLGVGDLRLDLSGLDPAGATLTSTAALGIGDLQLTVPGDVEVRLVVHDAIGSVQLPGGESHSGVSGTQVYQLHPSDGRAAKGTLDLTLTVRIGDIQVVQA